MLFGDKNLSGKDLWTQLLCFFEDREAFPKTCSFRNEKLVVSGCVGFPSRDELGVGGGGGRRSSPSDGTVLLTPRPSEWWCLPLLLFLGGGAGQGRWGWISFFFLKWCCVFPSPSDGWCCFPPSFVGVVPHSHRMVLLYSSSFWVVVVSCHIHIYFYILDQCLFDKRQKDEVRKPERRRVRHHHPRMAFGATPTKEGGKQYPPEGEENGHTIIFTLSHCSQHVILTEFQIMLLKWRVKISVESTKSE